jgi:hypothetical protein
VVPIDLDQRTLWFTADSFVDVTARRTATG